MIEVEKKGLSIRSQCNLIGINRSSYYYQPKIDPYELTLLNLVDEIYTRTPFYGSRRITWVLRELGHRINRKRIGRLMNILGIHAIYPKPNLSKSETESKKYPYLLGALEINYPNMVWATDITYIRMLKGFMYLTVILDWNSRFIISWRLSNTLETDFCLEALEGALKIGKPEIFNSDQGTQFTSKPFIDILEKNGIKISMDGRGRCFDNIFVERFWRTIKYENIYPSAYENVNELRTGLEQYIKFYNEERPHASLGYLSPLQVYKGVMPSNGQNLRT